MDVVINFILADG